MSTRFGATAYLPTTKGRTDAWRRRADDPATLLRLIACRMRQRLLVLKAPRRDRAVEAAAAGFREDRWSRRHANPLIDRTPGYYGPLN